MYKGLKDYIVSDNLKGTCNKVTLKCIPCNTFKTYNSKYGGIKGNLHSKKPKQTYSTDIIGPFDTSYFKTNISTKKFWLLTITDMCTRFTQCYILKTLQSSELVRKFKTHFDTFGKPQSVLSDNGTNYTSANFEKFLQQNQIKHSLTTPYNPTGNGISERLNKTITETLRIYQGKKLHRTIAIINKRINIFPNRIMKCSPYELEYGHNYFDLLKISDPKKLSRAIESSLRQCIMTEKKTNLKRKSSFKYKKNMKIFVKNITKNKLDKKWLGPCIIVDIDQNENRLYIRRKNQYSWINIKMCRPYGGESVVFTTSRSKTEGSK